MKKYRYIPRMRTAGPHPIPGSWDTSDVVCTRIQFPSFCKPELLGPSRVPPELQGTDSKPGFVPFGTGIRLSQPNTEKFVFNDDFYIFRGPGIEPLRSSPEFLDTLVRWVDEARRAPPAPLIPSRKKVLVPAFFSHSTFPRPKDFEEDQERIRTIIRRQSELFHSIFGDAMKGSSGYRGKFTLFLDRDYVIRARRRGLKIDVSEGDMRLVVDFSRL